MRRHDPRQPLSRRGFLAAAGAFSLVAGFPEIATGIGPLNVVKIARLRLPGDRRTRPHALTTLASEVRLQTSVDIATDVAQIGLNDADLFQHPLLFWIGDQRFRRLSSRLAGRLKTWLEAGGTLIVDNVGEAKSAQAFDSTFREQMKRIFPRIPLRKVPADHVLYRSFYRIDYPAGRRIDRPWLDGLSLDGRLAVIYSTNDLTGAWSREPTGRWEFDVQPGGQRQRQVALNLGINLVEYTLCQSYKDDQVHLDYLLHKRRWKVRRNPSAPHTLDVD